MLQSEVARWDANLIASACAEAIHKEVDDADTLCKSIQRRWGLNQLWNISYPLELQFAGKAADKKREENKGIPKKKAKAKVQV